MSFNIINTKLFKKHKVKKKKTINNLTLEGGSNLIQNYLKKKKKEKQII